MININSEELDYYILLTIKLMGSIVIWLSLLAMASLLLWFLYRQVKGWGTILAAVDLYQRKAPPTNRDLQREISSWATVTFPGQTVESKLAHLKDEVDELIQAPGDGEEMADCVILLFNLAELQGFDLIEEARRKMEKNRLRTIELPEGLKWYLYKGRIIDELVRAGLAESTARLEWEQRSERANNVLQARLARPVSPPSALP